MPNSIIINSLRLGTSITRISIIIILGFNFLYCINKYVHLVRLFLLNYVLDYKFYIMNTKWICMMNILRLIFLNILSNVFGSLMVEVGLVLFYGLGTAFMFQLYPIFTILSIINILSYSLFNWSILWIKEVNKITSYHHSQYIIDNPIELRSFPPLFYFFLNGSFHIYLSYRIKSNP